MSATLTSRPLPNLSTRRPTGKPSWPTVLLAGVEGSGKTWKAVELSTWDLIGRTFFVEVGEDTADEYGAIPGADYEIVPHDGTYLGILDAIRWADAQPPVDGKPNLIVLDSGSVLWDLIVDEQQLIANRRAMKKAQRYNKPVPREDQDVTITTDQWNVAKDRWLTLVNILRRHPGPAIVCCRLTETTIMDANGAPTKDKDWKVAAHKSLPFDANLYVQMRAPYATGRGHGHLVKARSAVTDLNDVDMGDDWTLTGVFKVLGLDKVVSTDSTYVEPNAGAYEAEYDAEVAATETADAQAAEGRQRADAGDLPDAARVMGWITESLQMAPDDGRRRLLQVRSMIGASNLEKIGGCKTRDGEVNAAVAIDKALEVIKSRAAGEQGEQSAPPAAPAETPPAPVETPAEQPAAAPAVEEPPAAPAEPVEPPATPAVTEAAAVKQEADDTPPKPVRETSAQKMQRIGLEEVRFQAEVLGIDPRVHMGLADGEDPRQVKPARLRAFVIGARAQVCSALSAQGRATECDLYARAGDAYPVSMDVVFERTDG